MRASIRGFTLIELVIVLVLIGILAAVAIPRFHDMKDNAEEASIRGTLGNVRSAITIWRANNLANGNDAAWPPYAGFVAAVLDTPLPENPWAATPNANIFDATAVASGARTIGAGGNGWAYNTTYGTFWANTDLGPDGAGTKNENEW